MTTKHKPKSPSVRRRAVDRLYKAVANYIEANGGNVVVIGGVQLQQWPGESELKYVIAVKCTGRRPEFAEADKP